jgi:hypothetical protein
MMVDDKTFYTTKAEMSLRDLKYIGSYLERNFREQSYWPPDGAFATRQPITTQAQLLTFVRTRGSQNIAKTKERLTLWLKDVTRNERAGQCIEPGKRIRNRVRLYKVRESNLEGYNAIVEFLRENLAGTVHYGKIPAKLPHISVKRKYPVECKVN